MSHDGPQTNNLLTAKHTPKSKKLDESHYRAIMSLPIENKAKFRECYKVGHIVAKSTIGAIRKCLHIATKQIRLVEFISKRIIAAKPKTNYLEELDRICELNHPNIANSYEIFQDSRSELCPESLLLDTKSKDANIKIFDFGLNQLFDPDHNLRSSSLLPFYDAPEVINKAYDSKCDIWSAGVILYVLLCGYPPFNGKTSVEVSKIILKGKFSFASGNWVSVSKEAKDLILKMLIYDPKERISASEGISHPWISTLYKGDKLLHQPIATQSLQQLKHFMVVKLHR